MDKFIKVEGCPGLVKDTNTGAVISNKKSDYEEFKKRKMEKLKMQSLEQEVAKLKAFCISIGYVE